MKSLSAMVGPAHLIRPEFSSFFYIIYIFLNLEVALGNDCDSKRLVLHGRH